MHAVGHELLPRVLDTHDRLEPAQQGERHAVMAPRLARRQVVDITINQARKIAPQETERAVGPVHGQFRARPCLGQHVVDRRLLGRVRNPIPVPASEDRTTHGTAAWEPAAEPADAVEDRLGELLPFLHCQWRTHLRRPRRLLAGKRRPHRRLYRQGRADGTNRGRRRRAPPLRPPSLTCARRSGSWCRGALTKTDEHEKDDGREKYGETRPAHHGMPLSRWPRGSRRTAGPRNDTPRSPTAYHVGRETGMSCPASRAGWPRPSCEPLYADHPMAQPRLQA